MNAISYLQELFNTENGDMVSFNVFGKGFSVKQGMCNRISLILACLLINICIVGALYSILGYPFDSWLPIFILLTMVSIIYQTAQMVLIKIKIFSLPVIFLVCSYIFHLSYTFLMLFNVDMTNVLTWFTLEEFKRASTLALFFILFLSLGFLCCDISDIHIKKKLRLPELNSNKTVLFAYMLLAVSLACSFYINISKIWTLVTRGYLEAATLDVNQLAMYASYLLMSAVFILLLYYKDNKKVVRSIGILYVLYQFFAMMTGQRAYAFIQLILFVLIYNVYIDHKTFKKKHILYLIITGFLFMVWLMIIREYRQAGGFSLSIFKIDGILDIIASTLKEFGATIYVITETIAFDSVGRGIGGKQLVCAVLSPVPFVSRIFPDIYNSNIYTALNLFRVGGSYIADFYYDFGYLGCFGVSLFGWFISKTDVFIRKGEHNNFYFLIAPALPFIVELMFSVRSGLYSKPRTLVYCAVMYLFVYGISKLTLQAGNHFKRRRDKT